jgi:hypothetical protein
MKKLLFVLALGAFTACGTGGSSTTDKDSTANDTSMTTSPDTSGSMPADTSHADTSHKK